MGGSDSMSAAADPRHAALAARIEARMAADSTPAPGAVFVVRRFLAAMAERRAAPDAPPAAVFEAAAASESTLALLLRALPKYAPEIGLAAARELRTAIADLMRRTDPAAAARMISGVLGHRDPRSAEAYRALCAGDAAAQSWAEMRARIADAGAAPAG